MIRQYLITAIATLMILSVNAAAETTDSYYEPVNRAIGDKNFALAETLLSRYLQQQPKNIEADFLLARVLSWQGKWTQAMDLFNNLLQEQPNNADFLLARANTLEWTGHRKAALQDLKNARQRSPDYLEIWRTEILYLSKENSPSTHSQLIALTNEAKQKFPGENWQHAPLAEETKIINTNNYAVEASYGHDELSNNRAPWEISSLKLHMQTPDKHFSHLQLDQIERFDLDDWQIGGSHALPFLNTWYFYAGATYSPSHKVVANWMLDTKISKSFTNGLNLHLGISQAKYSDTDSQQLHLSGEYYWSDFRTAYTYRLIDVENAGTGNNHNIQLNRYYEANSFIGATIAKGKDVEFNGTNNPPISDVLTFSIYGRHAFLPQWSLTYAFIHHQQGDFYNRNGFVLGLKFDF